MRCYCCNVILSDEEATAKFAESGNFVEMCKECRGSLPAGLEILTRSDLMDIKDKDEGDEDGYEVNYFDDDH